MGCGCKDKQTQIITDNGEKEPFNLLTFLGRLGVSLILLTLLIIVSPLMMLFIWYMMINAVFGRSMNMSKNVIGIYKGIKYFSKDDDEGVDLEDINPDDYELEGVDIVK